MLVVWGDEKCPALNRAMDGPTRSSTDSQHDVATIGTSGTGHIPVLVWN